MPRKFETLGEVNESGKVIIHRKHDLQMWLKGHSEKDIRLTFQVYSGARTSPQNRYYWGTIVQMIKIAINDLGNTYTSLEIHDFLKSEFNYSEVETPDGCYLKVPESTTKLDTIGFNEYKERIQHFASEVLGLYIPDPNEAEIFNKDK